MQFVAKFWSDDEAAGFAQQLDSAAPDRFPAIADLMRDQVAGRLPRLRSKQPHGVRQVGGTASVATPSSLYRYAGNDPTRFSTAGPGSRC